MTIGFNIFYFSIVLYFIAAFFYFGMIFLKNVDTPKWINKIFDFLFVYFGYIIVGIIVLGIIGLWIGITYN